MLPTPSTAEPPTVLPPEQRAIADKIRSAYEAGTALLPVGGRTALDYGAAVAAPIDELDLTTLNKVIDYTPRDMTILVAAGIRMADLASTLASEGQTLPIDVPRTAEATLGGAVATNWNGPRRYGHGTIRDYVIGIHAIDGRGTPFKGGGRVVKNVAGYDFCKLLVGSLGTLGVVTQLALKLRPIPESTATVVAACADTATAEILLQRFAQLPAMPVAIDYLLGPGWQVPTNTSTQQAEINAGTPHMVIRVEGTQQETAWLSDVVQTELQKNGGMSVAELSTADANKLFAQQVEFSDRGTGSESSRPPLVVKAAVPASGVARMVALFLAFDPQCAIQAHAGSGIVIARFTKFSHSNVTPTLLGAFRPAAVKLGGSLTVVSTTLDGLTPHLIWGPRTDATVLMENIKRQFDPKNILNPGRFIY